MANHSRVVDCLGDKVVASMEDLASTGLMMITSVLVVETATSIAVEGKGFEEPSGAEEVSARCGFFD